MTRRYTNVEPKPVADLVPGDEILVRRRVHIVSRWTSGESTTISVTWDDGTTQSYDLADHPSLEVVVQKAAG